jgi:type II restriction/modification system DNA methylase subunit YeeA
LCLIGWWYLSVTNEHLKETFKLFDNYNFTIIEDTSHESEVAIDPEMLGKVFEMLLPDKKEKGAFYTPREIVHYMCKQSIEYYLQNKPKNINELEYLKKIKILDPAIGSGAFPMGILHELIAKRISLGDKTDITDMKKDIIQNNIYGIDIEISAVEIAKLRFWISIIVDEQDPRPLPNLDFKIMQGNSLIDTVDGIDIFEKEKDNLFEDEKYFLELNKNLKIFFKETNSSKKSKLRLNINNLKNKILKCKLEDYKDKLNSRLNNLSILNKRNKDKLSKNIRIDLKKIDSFEKTYKDIFFYKIWFGEIMQNGGFDIVIGNPPYVRQEKIKDLKPKLKIEGYKSYNGTADLYIYFFEKGYNLLKDNGILSYITSNKYTRAKYGKEFREFLLENASILEYIDFNGVKVFKTATVDTSILIFSRQKSKLHKFTYVNIDESYTQNIKLEDYIKKYSFRYNQDDLNQDSFTFLDPNELKIKKQIEKIGTPLKEWDIKIYRGILTGFNEAFIIDKAKKEELIQKDPNSAEIIKPLLRGRDIKRYGYEFANLYLINTHNNPPIDVNKYLAIKEHLDNYYDKLAKRTDKGDTPYNLRNCAYLDEFEKEKIVWAEMTDENNFMWDSNRYYVNQTCYFITNTNKYVLAILNSKIINFYIHIIASNLGRGAIRWIKQYIEQLPIPQISKKKQKPFEILVDYIIFLKQNKDETMSNYFEEVLDAMVFELYFEELFKKKKIKITKHLNNLIDISENQDNSKKLKIIKKVFDELNNSKHLIGNNLLYMENIIEIKIIRK